MSETLMNVPVQSPFTHDQLVERAGKWLRGSYKCRPVILEGSYNGGREIPDAIGWQSGKSVLVECKITRSDFLSDQKKTFRTEDRGMGSERWYMTPAGLVDESEVPEGWGLVEVKAGKCYKRVYPAIRTLTEKSLRSERNLLAGLLSAVQEPDDDYSGYHRHTHAAQNLGRADEAWTERQKSRHLKLYAEARRNSRNIADSLNRMLGLHVYGAGDEEYVQWARKRAEEDLSEWRRR